MSYPTCRPMNSTELAAVATGVIASIVVASSVH